MPGGILPLAAGELDEANVNLINLLNTLADRTINCGGGLSISPFLNTYQKCGAT